MSNTTKWVLGGLATLIIIRVVAGSKSESDVGKYAYNATNGVYQGKIVRVGPCRVQPSINCYAIDTLLGKGTDNERNVEHPVDNVTVRDRILNPEEDL